MTSFFAACIALLLLLLAVIISTCALEKVPNKVSNWSATIHVVLVMLVTCAAINVLVSLYRTLVNAAYGA